MKHSAQRGRTGLHCRDAASPLCASLLPPPAQRCPRNCVQVGGGAAPAGAPDAGGGPPLRSRLPRQRPGCCAVAGEGGGRQGGSWGGTAVCGHGTRLALSDSFLWGPANGGILTFSPPAPLPTRQVATGSGAALLDSADAVLAVKRTPQKMFGLLDMHQAVEAALPPLRAALAAGGGHRSLERTSMGAGAAEQPPFVSQLSQVCGGGRGRGWH